MEINADGWLRPREALKILSESFSIATARDVILGRLQGDQINSIAMSMAWEARHKGPVKQGFCVIPARHWAHSPIGRAWDEFWETGDVRFFYGTLDGFPPGVAFRCYDVRFEPFGIEALLPSPKSPPAETVLSTDVQIVAKEAIDEMALLPLELANGSEVPLVKIQQSAETKPISEAHLNAWWIFYQSVTLPSMDTEPYAIAHFHRCFPENKVPRKKIRDLRGARKSGPKPRTAE